MSDFKIRKKRHTRKFKCGCIRYYALDSISDYVKFCEQHKNIILDGCGIKIRRGK